jgi:hypothetical protein
MGLSQVAAHQRWTWLGSQGQLAEGLGPHPSLMAPSSTVDVIMCGVRGRPEGRLAMQWVLSHREWIVFITVTVLLSLLMTVAIHELELRSVS